MKFDLLLLSLLSAVVIVRSINYTTNFNSSKSDDGSSGDPISLPIILTSLAQQKTSAPISEIYNLKKYELKDTNYTPEANKLSQVEQEIIYQNEPPLSVFDINRITIEDYQLLEIKEFRIMLINPTKFRFCVNEIYTDSVQVKRIQQKRLPFCLNSTTKYPFFFNLYITEHKPLIFRTSVYFIISIYDGNTLVQEKIWPRQIVVKVNHNHLRLGPLQAKKCDKSFTTLVISNPQPHHIKITFDIDLRDVEKNQQKKILKQVTIPSMKNFRLNIIPHETTMTITTRAYDLPDIGLPKLYMPIYCIQPLTIDHFDIGILNSERSVVEVPIPVTNHANQLIEIHEISVFSSSQTAQLLPMQEPVEKVQAQSQHMIICRILVHLSKEYVSKTTVVLKILYSLVSSPNILEVKNTFTYREFRNPLSLGDRRFIDVTKLVETSNDPVLDNIFPIRNNLNLPLMLARVIFDEKKFKLSWLQDKREYIYPGQMRQQFSLQYIGTRKLSISPLKFLVTLEFNGNLYIPIEIVVYDHTLQCHYNNIQQKCSEMPVIDYGYFRNNQPKFKQVVIRNWNPVPKELQIKVKDNLIRKFGLNCSVSIYGPFPNYEITSRQANNSLYYYLKGNHFIIVNFALYPLPNATSGQTAFSIKTQSETFTKSMKFKVENGTIALIPQVLRIHSAYEKSVQYLNLVSTFSQSYRIKSTVSNVSNLNVFFNNHSQIHENQWVGLALMFTPFTRLNLTETCCGSDYAINVFITSLYVYEFKRFTYAGIKVTTTTQLQINSTVIIDNNPPKIIQEENIEISLLQTNQPSLYTIPISNFFSEPMKFKVIIVPRYLYENAKFYMSTMRKVRKVQEEFLFCVNPHIRQKHNLNAQTIKAMFNLQAQPQQVDIPLEQANEYYAMAQRKNSQDSPHEYSTYVVNIVRKGASKCFKMVAAKYLKELVETEVLNHLAEKQSNEIFVQFVEKQMQYFNFPSHFLQFDEFYHTLSFDLEIYCSSSSFSLFKFCKHINLNITPNQQTVVYSNQTQQIKIGTATKTFNEPFYEFYLTILNNITKYETHFVKINITEPKMEIMNVYLDENSSLPKEQFQEHFFDKKDWNQIYKNKDIQAMKEEVLAAERKKILPIFVTNSDHKNNSFEGERAFDLKNVGNVQIQVTHMGFDNIQRICSYKGVEILGEQCQSGFLLEPNEVKRLQLRFSFGENENMDEILKRKLFFYNDDKYYFSSMIATKFSDKNKKYHSYRKSINSLFLNIVSFFFLIFVIWNLKKESDEKQKEIAKKSKSKIMDVTRYKEIGSVIERRPRKLETISEEQIAMVKELQDRKLKEFFNSSGQSQIMSKPQIQDEGSQNQKQEKANISVSEESSIDFMDFNNFNNRSSEACIENHPEQFEEISDPSEGENDILTSGWDKLSVGYPQDFDFDDDMKSMYDKKEDRPEEFREESKEENKSYFNVFFSENPLKKSGIEFERKNQRKDRR